MAKTKKQGEQLGERLVFMDSKKEVKLNLSNEEYDSLQKIVSNDYKITPEEFEQIRAKAEAETREELKSILGGEADGMAQ